MKQGVSMIEVLIGVIILALILIPSLNAIISQTRTVTATRDHTQAVFVAQRVLETARTYRFEQLDKERTGITPAEANLTLEHLMQTDATKNRSMINGIEYKIVDFKVEGVKNKVDPSAVPTLVLVSFGVDYLGKDNRGHRLDITTALTQQE